MAGVLVGSHSLLASLTDGDKTDIDRGGTTYSFDIVKVPTYVATKALTWAAAQTFSGAVTLSSTVTIGALAGVLKASAGVVSGSATTSDLNEGSNLYYTNARVASLIQNGTGVTWSYNSGAGTLTPTVSLSAFTTSNLSEGSNLYYTDARARAAVSAGTGVTYSSSTGVIAIGQAVGTGSSPTFAGLTLTGFSGVLSASAGVVSAGSITTSSVAEGSNLYFTNERVDDQVATLIQNGTGITWTYNDGAGTLTPAVSLSAFSTSNLSEGSNLYFTNERVDDRVAALIQNGTGITWVYDDTGGTLTPTVSLSSFTTDNVAEGATNLYYTNARARAAVSASGAGLSYNSGTGAFTNTGVTALAGTTNRISVTASTGSITISAPQDLHTGASPTYAGLTISGNSVTLGNLTVTSAATTSRTLTLPDVTGTAITTGNTSALTSLDLTWTGINRFGDLRSTKFAAPNLQSKPFGAARPNSQYSGTNWIARTGNLSKGETLNIVEGLPGGFFQNWDGSNRYHNAFGGLCRLLNGDLITIYRHGEQEGAQTGTANIEIRFSTNGGGVWSDATTLFNAATYHAVSDCADPSIWQTSTGRIFATFIILKTSTNYRRTRIMYTDDPTGRTGWTAASTALDYATWTDQFNVSCPGVELSNGNLLTLAYGKATGATYRSIICMRSTDNGATWNLLATVANGPGDSVDYKEPHPLLLQSGTLHAYIRCDVDNTIRRSSSIDSGGSWGAISAQFDGNGKPVVIQLSDVNTLVAVTRSPTTTDTEAVMYTSRDIGATWGPAWNFDDTHYHFAYAGLAELSPGVVGCAWSHGPSNPGTRYNWVYACFSDGATFMPTGESMTRDVIGKRVAVNGQILQARLAPVLPPTGGDNVDVQARGLLTTILEAGQTFGYYWQHPGNLSSILGCWEPNRMTYVYRDTFVRADSVSAVASASRLPVGQAIAPTQLAGTWGTQSNKLYLSSTSGGSGPYQVIAWDFAKGDGTFELNTAYDAEVDVAFRIVDSTNYLFAAVGNTYVRIYKVASGTPTQLATAGHTMSAGQAVRVKVVTSGNSISVYTNVNNGGYSSTANVSHTLSGGDATTYANTNTKWGVLTNGTSSIRYGQVDFTGSFASGDYLAELTDMSVNGTVGSLLQATQNNQGRYTAYPWLFNGAGFVWQSTDFGGANGKSYASAAFTSIAQPLTIFWAGVLTTEAATARSIVFTNPGSGPYAAVGANDRIVYMGSNGSTVSAPAFSTYSMGPTLLCFEYNGASSKLYRDGLLVASGSAGTGAFTVLGLGDATNHVEQATVGMAAFSAVLTDAERREHGRYWAETYNLRAWTPYGN